MHATLPYKQSVLNKPAAHAAKLAPQHVMWTEQQAQSVRLADCHFLLQQAESFVLQVVNFYSNKLTPDPSAMMQSLARMLPDDISVLNMQRVPPDFHARFTAQSKVYHYHVTVAPKVDPFTRAYSGRVTGPLDLDYMRRAICVQTCCSSMACSVLHARRSSVDVYHSSAVKFVLEVCLLAWCIQLECSSQCAHGDTAGVDSVFGRCLVSAPHLRCKMQKIIAIQVCWIPA